MRRLIFIFAFLDLFFKFAVCAGSNTSDVLDISRSPDGWTVTVQTTGPDSISVYFKDSGQMREIAVSSAGIHKIKIIS